MIPCTGLIFLCLASFICYNALQVHLHCWNGRIFFFLGRIVFPGVYINTHTHTRTHYIVFIHSSVDRLWCCFNTLTIVNIAAICMEVQIFLWNNTFIPLNMYSEVGLLNSMSILILICWGISILFSAVVVSVYTLTDGTQMFHLYPYRHLLFLIFLIIAILTSVRWYLTVVWTVVSEQTLENPLDLQENPTSPS